MISQHKKIIDKTQNREKVQCLEVLVEVLLQCKVESIIQFYAK